MWFLAWCLGQQNNILMVYKIESGETGRITECITEHVKIGGHNLNSNLKFDRMKNLLEPLKQSCQGSTIGVTNALGIQLSQSAFERGKKVENCSPKVHVELGDHFFPVWKVIEHQCGQNHRNISILLTVAPVHIEGRCEGLSTWNLGTPGCVTKKKTRAKRALVWLTNSKHTQKLLKWNSMRLFCKKS